MAKGVKTGGRKEGTPNRDRKDLMERLNEKFPGYDPVLAMAEIANNPIADIRLKLQANKEVAKYTHPQLKTIEYKDIPTLEVFLAMTPEERLAKIKELRETLNAGE